MHWKEIISLLAPTKDRYGSFFAIIISVISVRSIIEVFLHGDDPLSYVFILLTAILTASYGLMRFLEVFRSPGMGIRYLIRSVNVVFMLVILVGEFFFRDELGRMAFVVVLIAIEFNLVSIYAEYTGRLQRLKMFLMKLLHLKK